MLDAIHSFCTLSGLVPAFGSRDEHPSPNTRWHPFKHLSKFITRLMSCFFYYQAVSEIFHSMSQQAARTHLR